jgi:hypothetical protein
VDSQELPVGANGIRESFKHIGELSHVLCREKLESGRRWLSCGAELGTVHAEPLCNIRYFVAVMSPSGYDDLPGLASLFGASEEESSLLVTENNKFRGKQHGLSTPRSAQPFGNPRFLVPMAQNYTVLSKLTMVDKQS